MGATSTMRVSRDAALAALAKIEHASLSDEAIAERLNDAIRAGGYSLDEVRIGSDGDDWDQQNLERIADGIAR